MKTPYSLLLLFNLLFTTTTPFISKAQSDIPFCGADEAHKRLLQQYPEILQEETKLENYTRNYINRHPAGHADRAGNIIIPVVFHIIHQGGPENVSDAQIYDAMKILNRDFNKRNIDTFQVTDPVLKNLIANVGIEFRMANIDPQGNYTNAIDRIYSVQTYVGNDYSKLNGWAPDKYMNIWVVNNMGGGAAGYSYYPGTVAALYNTPSMDGVQILHNYLGSMGTSVPLRSRALTHEVGHYLNLKHVWGDSNAPGVACGDDQVNDTPITKGYTSCPTDATAKICNPLIVENYQNYMDYSYCSVMFTHGQKARMLAALESNVAKRSNLYSPENLVATGVLDTPAKAPMVKADFIPASRYTCLNGSVTFKNLSVSGATYAWEFPNGNPNTSTDANPTVQFLLPGWQPVKLTVTDTAGNTSTKSDDIRVYVGSDIAIHQAPYHESFEDQDIFNSPAGWASANLDGNNTFFRQWGVPHWGAGSAYLNNYFARNDRDIDEIISPPYDLTPLTQQQMKMSFYYSWASANPNFIFSPDSLCVYASVDCGKTWISIFKKKNAVLGYWEGPWSPSTESGVWKKEEINMSGETLYRALHKNNVRFKFQVFSSVGGNNFYLDDINIGFASTGIEETNTISEVSLFPNPSSGNATLSLQLDKASQVNVTLFNITGKEVQRAYHGALPEGINHLELNTYGQLAQGVYIVQVKAGENTTQRRFVIKL